MPNKIWQPLVFQSKFNCKQPYNSHPLQTLRQLHFIPRYSLNFSSTSLNTLKFPRFLRLPADYFPAHPATLATNHKKKGKIDLGPTD